MKDILEQYGETILACICALIIMGITVGLFVGPLNGLWESFFARLF